MRVAVTDALDRIGHPHSTIPTSDGRYSAAMTTCSETAPTCVGDPPPLDRLKPPPDLIEGRPRARYDMALATEHARTIAAALEAELRLGDDVMTVREYLVGLLAGLWKGNELATGGAWREPVIEAVARAGLIACWEPDLFPVTGAARNVANSLVSFAISDMAGIGRPR